MKRTLIYAGVGILLAIVVIAGLRELARARTFQLFGRLVAHVDTPHRRVALTFDDGPTSKLADSLAGVLSARRVKATFFVIGADLAAAPRAGQLLAAAGHELGNHTFTHPHMVLHSPGFIRSQIDRTDSLIRAAGYRGQIFFRPPYGYKLFLLPWHLDRTNRTTVMWDVEPDSYPEVSATADGIVRHVLERVRPGSIILLHPWYESRATSLASVGPLIDSLQARGYTVGTVGDLLRD